MDNELLIELRREWIVKDKQYRKILGIFCNHVKAEREKADVLILSQAREKFGGDLDQTREGVKAAFDAYLAESGGKHPDADDEEEQ